MTTGPLDWAKFFLGGSWEAGNNHWAACVLTAFGNKPTSLQITALVKCIQIITTQRPSQLLLLKHFLNLHVTRKHLFEGWVSHKFRSIQIYRKVARRLLQAALFPFPVSTGRSLSGTYCQGITKSEDPLALTRILSICTFSSTPSFLSWDDFYPVLIFIYILTGFNFVFSNEHEGWQHQ